MSRRSRPRRPRLSAQPVGVSPASNSSRRVAPPLRISTRTENPCSATGQSRVSPASSVRAPTSAGAAPVSGPPSGSRLAGPWPGSRMSIELSQTVSTDTESTGSRGSTSPVQAGPAAAAATLGTCTSPPVSHTSVHPPVRHGPAAAVSSRAGDDVPKIVRGHRSPRQRHGSGGPLRSDRHSDADEAGKIKVLSLVADELTTSPPAKLLGVAEALLIRQRRPCPARK